MSGARLAGLSAEAERAVSARFDRLDRQIAALTKNEPVQPPLIETDFTAQEGQTLFFSAPATGKKLLLPAPRALNRAARITLVFTTTGPVTISCGGGLVNGSATLITSSVGAFRAVCDGITGWFVESFSALGGASLDYGSGGLDYVGSTSNVNLSSLTGAQGVVNIATLECGGSVTVSSVSADYTIAGFTGKTDGFWFVFIDRRSSGTAVGSFLEDSGTTTTSIRNPEGIASVLPFASRSLFYYFNGRWRSCPAALAVAPRNLAVSASNIAVPFSIRVSCTAGTPGSADDVTIYNANAPFAFRILDVIWLDSTAIALSTVQLRDTSGGGGAALSSALTAAVTGTARNNDTATRTVAANGSVFLRRSDRGVAGEILIVAVRT